MVSKPILFAFIFTIKVLTIVSVFYEFNLSFEDCFKHIFILMIGLTFITIVIASIFICLVKFQQKLNSKKENDLLFSFSDENISLNLQQHRQNQRVLMRDSSVISMTSLESVPSYNKVISTSISANPFTSPPPPYSITSENLITIENENNLPPNYDESIRNV